MSKIQLADKNVNEELEFLLMGMFRVTRFVLQESKDSQRKRFRVQQTCMKLCGTVVVWITVSLRTVFLQM